jgi:catechol 2,3-dioxygenase-like lactoylglutathione lyase family enzyme
MTLTVEDLNYTLHFYRDQLGFQPGAPTNFGSGGLDVAGLKGAQYRTTESVIPGTQMHLDFVEFKGVQQKMYHPTIHDVGATLFRLGVPDVNVLTQNLRNAGIPVVSTTGQPTGMFIMAQAPDDTFIQFYKTR